MVNMIWILYKVPPDAWRLLYIFLPFCSSTPQIDLTI
jgi:hypothetical protein